jgi:hypothetical protein
VTGIPIGRARGHDASASSFAASASPVRLSSAGRFLARLHSAMRLWSATCVLASICLWAGADAWRCCAAGPPADRAAQGPAISRPIGPDELPEILPGRWKISLCVSEDNAHAWIRLENPETGAIRSIGRYHLLVGGWFDFKHVRWNYPPTFRTGVYMDREQSREAALADGNEILRTAWVERPTLFVGESARGHAIVRNNCATYARDAWHFYTGEYLELPAVHTPRSLRQAVVRSQSDIRKSRRQTEQARWRRPM